MVGALLYPRHGSGRGEARLRGSHIGHLAGHVYNTSPRISLLKKLMIFIKCKLFLFFCGKWEQRSQLKIWKGLREELKIGGEKVGGKKEDDAW